MTLTEQDKTALVAILNNQYANGPFCGMVFSQVAQQSDWSDEKIAQYVELALHIRTVATEMTKNGSQTTEAGRI